MRTEFAVIGAGLTGLSAAWALTRRGRQVVVLEQARTGHQHGGSHGSCRIFRLGYEDPDWVSLAIRARDIWTDLEQESGQQLLHPAAQLTFGPLMHDVQAAMDEAGAPFEWLPAAEAARRFPGVRADGDVLLETHSAVIAADRALSALAQVTSSAAHMPGTKASALADDGRRVRVTTSAGDIEADCVIVCAGPWTASLLAPAGIPVPGSATLEQVAYLVPRNSAPASAPAAGPAEADTAQPDPMPIFVHYGGEFPYGLPVPGSGQYKIGIHHGGPAIDPDEQHHDADAALSHRIGQAARTLLPGFEPEPAAVERCVYDNSPDTDFIVDRIGNIVIGSGTSGHGFKFGPLMGEWLAFLGTTPGGQPHAAEPAGAPPARFALSRFA